MEMRTMLKERGYETINDIKGAVTEWKRDPDYPDAPFYWREQDLTRERKAWTMKDGKDTELSTLMEMDRFENRLFVDEKGNCRDLWSWVDSMTTYTFRPFRVYYYDMYQKDAGWRKLKRETVGMKVAAFTPDEAIRIAAARIAGSKWHKSWEAAVCIIPSSPLVIESEDRDSGTLDGFIYHEDADIGILFHGNEKKKDYYKRDDAHDYLLFIDSFGRKYSKDRHLYPAPGNAFARFWNESAAFRGYTWDRNSNFVDTLDISEFVSLDGLKKRVARADAIVEECRKETGDAPRFGTAYGKKLFYEF